MINTMLAWFSRSSILDDPSFWFTLVGIIGLIIIVYLCFKYPNLGKPVIFTAFGIMVLAIDVYCVIQLNIYYTAEGGIHGYLTGIFETNKVEVVDTLTFKIDNIELLETTEGVYTASITTDEVLSLDTRQNLGVFINGVPCDTTSEVHVDYAIANYPYLFYDQNKDLVCTDTLILNFAFYDNSTYLSLTTKGGTLPVEECVKYWHHYFNKNGFEVKIAPFNNASGDIFYSNGDVSNYVSVTYYVGNEVYATDYVVKGRTLNLKTLNSSSFIGWTNVKGEVQSNTAVITENTEYFAKLGLENITFNIKTGWVDLGDGSTSIISSAESPVITYGGEEVEYEYTSRTSLGGLKSVSIADFNISATHTDSLTVINYTTINVNADGDYTITENEDGSCVISWENCTSLSISIVNGCLTTLPTSWA